MKREVESWEEAWNNAKTDKERQQALKDYDKAKQRNAARREQERLEKPGMIDKFLAGIDKIKALFRNKQARQIQQGQDKTR